MWIANIIAGIIIWITPPVDLKPNDQFINDQVELATINIVDKDKYYEN